MENPWENTCRMGAGILEPLALTPQSLSRPHYLSVPEALSPAHSTGRSWQVQCEEPIQF